MCCCLNKIRRMNSSKKLIGYCETYPKVKSSQLDWGNLYATRNAEWTPRLSWENCTTNIISKKRERQRQLRLFTLCLQYPYAVVVLLSILHIQALTQIPHRPTRKNSHSIPNSLHSRSIILSSPDHVPRSIIPPLPFNHPFKNFNPPESTGWKRDSLAQKKLPVATLPARVTFQP